MSVHATWFIDWFFVSSSSSSCEATAIIVLIILSLYRGSAVRKHTHTHKKNPINIVSDYCSVEALHTNVLMGFASVTSWAGHSSLWWFSAGMSTAGTGFCSVAARTAGCVFVVDVGGGGGGGGWSLFWIPLVALWILYGIANRAVFLRPWREVHFRSSIIAEALDVLLYRYMTKHAAWRWVASVRSICCWVYGSQTVHAYSRAVRTHDL